MNTLLGFAPPRPVTAAALRSRRYAAWTHLADCCERQHRARMFHGVDSVQYKVAKASSEKARKAFYAAVDAAKGAR